MKQSELNRAVARATGETVSTIKRLGFLLADPSECLEPDSDKCGPHVIDWDELEAQRDTGNTWRPPYEPAAA